MIRDLSKTLEALLTQQPAGFPSLPAELAAAQILFDRPVQAFNPASTAIDIFLYDIRENLELRSNEPTVERNGGQAVIRRPPVRLDCTYLITAWPVGGMEVALQEHRLLAQVMQVFSSYPTIPEPFLQGSLQGQEPPLPLLVTAPDTLRNPAEFWTSLGTPLRASLAVKVTVALEPLKPAAETLPLTLTHQVDVAGEVAYQILGRVRDASSEPVVGATVRLVERNLTATTEAEGTYRLTFLPSGNYTLQVQPPGGAGQDFPLTVPAPAGSNYDVQLPSS